MWCYTCTPCARCEFVGPKPRQEHLAIIVPEQRPIHPLLRSLTGAQLICPTRPVSHHHPTSNPSAAHRDRASSLEITSSRRWSPAASLPVPHQPEARGRTCDISTTRLRLPYQCSDLSPTRQNSTEHDIMPPLHRSSYTRCCAPALDLVPSM
ncbi:hypothetical protein PYCCODRAFT_773257 [Trametes coccinea BRFM310]|uniref:Uncharacterized protein n=1 Tax=Trametes coccinea (strain BRFM310) TaxID=1353009 RepID=A0A1Y2J1R8_TRAC3|nr:hypothetical protein PYCCODRAFT_773257 [Trametes coccinea BRFM310]